CIDTCSNWSNGFHLDWWRNDCSLVITHCHCGILWCICHGSCTEKFPPGYGRIIHHDNCSGNYILTSEKRTHHFTYGVFFFVVLFSESCDCGCVARQKESELCLLTQSKKVVVFYTPSLTCEVSACVFRCGPLLSAGTASASSRSPLCGVFRHVLFPQESTVLRSKQPS